MAITLDSTAGGDNSFPATGSLTFAHTVNAGSNSILIVNIKYNVQASISGGVTYNGVAMTFLDRVSATYSGNPGTVEFWYLINPPVGTFNVVATLGFNAGYLTGCSASFFGVKQTSPFGTTVLSGGRASNSSITSAVTPTIIGSLLISCCQVCGSSSNTNNQTIVKSHQNSDGNQNRAIISSNGPVASLSPVNFTIGWSGFNQATQQVAVEMFAAAVASFIPKIVVM